MKKFRKLYLIGKTIAPSITIASPTSDITIIMMLTVLNVSVGDIPDILPITQKPLSFAHEIGFEPHPIANAR